MATLMKLLEMRAAAEILEKYCDEYNVRLALLNSKLSDNALANNEIIAEAIIINRLLDTLMEVRDDLRAELDKYEPKQNA